LAVTGEEGSLYWARAPTAEERLSFDPIALIERAYQHHHDTSSWLQGAIEDLVQALDPSCLAACHKPGITSLRQILGDTTMDRWLARRPEQPAPFQDSVGVMLPGPGAKPLVLAENTISAHLAAGLSRLGISSRAELIRTSTELASEALSALALH
jgi:hypothetical protein